MLALWKEIDRTATLFDSLQRPRYRVAPRHQRRAPTPRLRFFNQESSFKLTADVPGVTDEQVELTLEGEEVTISIRRNLEVPEGFTTVHSERASVDLSRRIALPGPVDASSARATVSDGLLTIEIDRAEQSLPVQISVKGA